MLRFGIDNIREDELKGKVGIVTNSSGVTSEIEQNVDFLLRKGVKVQKIFTPEHGLYGTEANGSEIENSSYKGIPAVSLYGKKFKPQKSDLEDLDLLLYDIQDAGVRFYTYISTLHNVVEAASENGIPVIVLDRPNPINATIIDGPVLEEEYKSFVGIDTLPARFGFTIGELSLYLNRKANGPLKIIELVGYKRNTYYDDLVKWFIPPSLNLPSVDAMINYSAMCLLESTDLSLGRGTPYPFLQFGKPDLPALGLSASGAVLRRTKFRPTVEPYAGKVVDGYYVHIIDRNRYNPYELTLNLFYELYRKEMISIDEKKLERLYGSAALTKALRNGKSPPEVMASWQSGLDAFREEAKVFHLYS